MTPPTPILIPLRRVCPIEFEWKQRVWLCLVHVGPEVRQVKAVDEDEDMFEWIAGILTVGLLVYLAVALLKPEWFA